MVDAVPVAIIQILSLNVKDNELSQKGSSRNESKIRPMVSHKLFLITKQIMQNFGAETSLS
jgi:hypothetical protein